METGSPDPSTGDGAGGLRWVAVGCGVFAVLLGLSAGQLFSTLKRTGYLPKFRLILPGRAYEVRAPAPAQAPSSTEPDFSPDDLDRYRLLLEQKKFAELDRAVSDLQTSFESDPSRERQIRAVVLLLGSLRPGYRELLDSWVAVSSASFASHLARGEYRFGSGWRLRGHAYADKTTERQFQEMSDEFAAAESDVDAALRRNPRLLNGYLMRMGVGVSARSRVREQELAFAQARSLFPTSFELYWAELGEVLPRWGGSYSEMEAIADAAVAASTDSYLNALHGRIYMDQAELMADDDRYARAIALYDRALSYGRIADVLAERSSAERHLRRYPEAMKDADEAVALHPSYAGGYMRRAEVEFDVDDGERATRDVRAVAERLPLDSIGAQWLPWAAQEEDRAAAKIYRNNPSLAATFFDAALAADPNDVYANVWRGILYLRNGDGANAREHLEKAASLAPDDFQAVQALDNGVLAPLGRWDDILPLWDRYLQLKPGDARAYMERAGTRHFKGDLEGERQDLRKACDLGNQGACGRLGRN